MDKKGIIALLNKNMEDEHAAIIQYLAHAYAFGESDLACEIEAIAREEMQHYRWLADKVVSLGGVPSTKRGTVVFAGPKMVDMLQADVAAEAQAIEQYRAHLEQIDDSAVAVVIRRILEDERAHKAQFEKYATEPDPEAMVRMEPALADADRRKAEFLHKDARHEYTVVLQYLAHAFMTPHCEVEHELEWQAIEEMRHLGWLAEEMEGLGTRFEQAHDPVVIPDDTEEMLKLNISIEQAVAAEYREQAAESPQENAQLFERIAKEEDHHIYIFSELLEEVERLEHAAEPVCPAAPSEDTAPSRPTFTVGSLLNQEQH